MSIFNIWTWLYEIKDFHNWNEMWDRIYISKIIFKKVLHN